MSDTAKVLAQSIPAAGSLTNVYTAALMAVVSSIKACNQSPYPTTFRISVAVAGAADSSKQYLYYDVAIPGNDTFTATEGWTLAATDVLRCQSANGSVSFNVFGIEIS